MKRPQFVYFDLGNVLCFFDHGISAKQMADIAGTDAKTIRQIVYESDLEHRYETGLISCEQFVTEIGTALGKQVPHDEMIEAASAMFKPNLEIVPVLESLRDQNIPLGLLSNTCHAHWTWIDRQNYECVSGWFDPIVLSYEVKSMKPDLAIYTKAAELAGTAPDQIFFTDDRTDNIEGAQRAGWKTSLFTDVKALHEVIKSWE